MKLLTSMIFFSIFLTSCSYFDDNSFTLVCDVDSEWNGNINGLKGFEKKKETVSLTFKDKKLESSGFDCPIWEKERISCGIDKSSEIEFRSERYVIDRMSGVIFYTKNSSDKNLKISEIKTYNGKCEKVKQKKF